MILRSSLDCDVNEMKLQYDDTSKKIILQY